MHNRITCICSSMLLMNWACATSLYARLVSTYHQPLQAVAGHTSVHSACTCRQQGQSGNHYQPKHTHNTTVMLRSIQWWTTNYTHTCTHIAVRDVAWSTCLVNCQEHTNSPQLVQHCSVLVLRPCGSRSAVPPGALGWATGEHLQLDLPLLYLNFHLDNHWIVPNNHPWRLGIHRPKMGE